MSSYHARIKSLAYFTANLVKEKFQIFDLKKQQTSEISVNVIKIMFAFINF